MRLVRQIKQSVGAAGRQAWSAVVRRRHLLPTRVDTALEALKWVPFPRISGAKFERAQMGRSATSASSPSHQIRILIGPANFAGQGAAWAGALNEVPSVCAQSWAFVANPIFDYPADYRQSIQVNRASRPWQREQFNFVATNFNAVVAESGRVLFGRGFGFDPAKELHSLAKAGLAVAVLWHGSDVRIPSEHIARVEASPYGLPEFSRRAAELEATATRNRRFLFNNGWPQLVSTPDLLLDVPNALWCPVVVKPSAHVRQTPALPDAGPLRVVHVPSNPILKGSDLIEPALLELQAEGLIEYARVQGVSVDEVRRIYADADIVLDQFRLGIYGVAAVEAMLSGALVVSDVDQAVREIVETQTQFTLPIVQASWGEVASVLRDIDLRRAEYRSVIEASREFAQEVHNGALSSRVILEALNLSA